MFSKLLDTFSRYSADELKLSKPMDGRYKASIVGDVGGNAEIATGEGEDGFY